ncbi:MAG: tRNA (adenosine(37)-N6)-threonylcarbamoyltransferase complex ATPase subunit type 1 TsaE [Bacteroidales bacterium]|nr:tRNA (adenosine(37)-N6)-threonylcarbamoyltransferase complex ATPase subunit type 1 TsaE [Bacteroidales bacterium]MCF8405641.1 tRNA (adenosine(37)-N6)-threonylcarbamoyltransferase complex ATPase subunit type 1 TsaE [Bacteroidales bacterium]
MCDSETQLPEIAASLLNDFPDQRIFAFYGEMGAGKTTFIKAICKKLEVIDAVSSPTFALVNIYFTEQEDEIYHFDFYRMEKPEEVYDIGYEDYFYSGNYCFLEWPEKVNHILPEEIVKVFIRVNKNTNARIIMY